MNDLPLVSIVIPVYNGSDYMSEAIDSALAQTYTNIEILVINDGSNDDGATRKIALGYGDKIRYFEKQNGGVATALNLGINEMKGEYFSWLSHDDKYFPKKIEKQMEFIFNHYFADVILYSDIQYIDSESNFISFYKFKHYSPENFRPAFIKEGLIHGCTLLIPRRCFVKCGNFNTELRTTQDYDLWFRFSEEFRFVHMPEIYVYSRIHENQDTKKLQKIVFDERDNLHLHFIKNIREDEINRFSNGDKAGYYISFAKRMDALRCIKAKKIALVRALKNLLVPNLIRTIENSLVLSIFISKILVRKIVHFTKSTKISSK